MPEWLLAPPRGSNDRAWLDMRVALWPDATPGEHLAAMAEVLARGLYVRLALDPAGAAVGFVEAAKRVDYVNGATSSPVAFLEGLYVVPAARRRGVARVLVESVVAWALAQGLSELASDSLIDNAAAHAAHRGLGFTETERVVCFLRPLSSPAKSR